MLLTLQIEIYVAAEVVLCIADELPAQVYKVLSSERKLRILCNHDRLGLIWHLKKKLSDVERAV